MSKRYYLYVWISNWNCYWPLKSYASLAYARKVALEKGSCDFYIYRSPYPFASSDDCKFYLNDCKHLNNVRYDF